MVKNVLNILSNKKYHISFAESCTGGLCASTLIMQDGASNVISESYVTYSNEVKMKILGVNKKTIDEFDVVSENVCYEMIMGLNKITGSEVCVSVSGYAGPTTENENIRVGTVCFGFYINGKTFTATKHFDNLSRSEVIRLSTEYVFFELERLLNII